MVEEEQMLNKPKRIALCLFGHMRTWDKTWQSLFKYIVEPNEACGFQVDIFIHTWDELESTVHTWHTQNHSLAGIKLTDADILKIKQSYKPKVISIEHLGLENGRTITMKKVQELCSKYEIENNIKYDYYIQTRPDIMFLSALLIETYTVPYMQLAELKPFPLPERYTFVATSAFQRFPFMDPRYIPENDIVWFSNSIIDKKEKNLLIIPINYILNKDFIMLRSDLPKPPSKYIKILRRFASCFIPSKSLRKKIRG